jgi:hypothetical protein
MFLTEQWEEAAVVPTERCNSINAVATHLMFLMEQKASGVCYRYLFIGRAEVAEMYISKALFPDFLYNKIYLQHN